MRPSGVKCAVVAALAVTLLGTTTTRALQQRAFSGFDVPNASSTNAQGINARGDIVGMFVDTTDKATHGFLLHKGAFTRIDYPGAIYTDARGINAEGEIVGSYRMPNEPAVNFHGYLLTKQGDFVAVDFPGHTNTIAQRITSTGLVLGCRHDTDLMTTMRGVTIGMRPPGALAQIDLFASMNNGATPDGGLIVGLFTDMDTGKGRGYLLFGDTSIPFDVPESSFTAAWDVNPSGAIVGVYRDGAGKTHGFLWDGGVDFSAVDFPDAVTTRAFGINPQGDIVGNYVDRANHTHGFVAVSPNDGR